MTKTKYNVIALMSGTSLDGVDLVHVILSLNDQWSFKVQHAETIAYDQTWQRALTGLVTKSKSELYDLDLNYSRYLGQLIRNFLAAHKIDQPDFVSSHGHTALHQPHELLTYQIGNLQPIADTSGCKVICDFRVQDVALGGQGAPLVPIGDRLLFGDYDYCLNLGGFANISYEKSGSRYAFDICPVNIVLNHYVAELNKAYDDKGAIAATGSINQNLLNALNRLEYFNLTGPKSLGLEWVSSEVFPLVDSFGLEIQDILRTYTEHIAVQIARTLRIDSGRVLVTGGGAYNDFLIGRISSLSKPSVVIPNAQIIEFKEAIIFALLGVLKQRNEVNCLKSITGARKDHSSGKILRPGDQN